MENKKTPKTAYILVIVALAVLMILQFILHRRTPFMKDDLWYATNLVTGDKISNPWDILVSQFWHYFNWGGRIINHALLQAVLATGELGADILNIIVTLVLGFVICIQSAKSGKKNPVYYLIAEALIISFNASLHFSMYWESGSVNYLYSTSWILAYVYVIFSELKIVDSNESSENIDKDIKKSGSKIWMYFLIIPLSFIAGMSTENMGPTCFVATCFVIGYLIIKKKKAPAYLYLGAAFSLIGSVLLILAPGNFVRNAFVEDKTIREMIDTRIDNFLLSMGSFIFAAFLIAFVMTAVYIRGFGRKLEASQAGLLGFAVVAQAAMMLSPAYPQRASFGIMCVLIAYIISLMKSIVSIKKTLFPYICIAAGAFYIHALIMVGTDLMFPPVG